MSALIADPNPTCYALKDLGGKLKLPPGQRFQVKALDQGWIN
jgi:hypothetical protein